MAKLLAADASWAAADMCVQTHGGFGFAEEFDIERKFRETRLYQVAPISTNLILSYLARTRARPAALLLSSACALSRGPQCLHEGHEIAPLLVGQLDRPHQRRTARALDPALLVVADHASSVADEALCI